MEHRNVIIIALTILCTWAGPGTCQSFTSGLSVAAVEEWDHFIFSMHWPQSICVERNETGIFNCSIPRETTSWIIHGLWPTNNTSEKPVCCKGAAFNRSLLDPIKDQLDVHWPNLFIGQTAGEFWKHEWKKHGTCAASMESLNTQLKYFNVTLSILEKFNIASGLAQFNIVPSDNTFYTVSDFQRAFNSLYNVSPKMLCFPSSRKSKNDPKRSAYQYISEIEFCMDKQFSNIECPRKIHPNSRPRPFCLHP
ncbi:hypothetical protein HELRODRAFT_185826, partial [Helobdella robusta]|uniref:Uncharacterized protein n=1 Tax=Helobdella robusta TaxID=6412 RepID=T1FNC2_HELRO